MAFRHFPLTIHDSECNVLVWSSSMETNCKSIVSAVLFKVELWSFRLISQIRVEDVEFVTLDHLGRRILRVVMHLVVFVPLVTLLDAVEEAGLTTHE